MKAALGIKLLSVDGEAAQDRGFGSYTCTPSQITQAGHGNMNAVYKQVMLRIICTSFHAITKRKALSILSATPFSEQPKLAYHHAPDTDSIYLKRSHSQIVA